MEKHPKTAHSPHPPLSSGPQSNWPNIWISTAIAIVALTGFALVFAMQNWISGGPYGRLVWPRNITVALVQWWTWGVLAPPIILLAARYPLIVPSRARLGAWTLGLAVAFLLHLTLVTGIERALDRVAPGEPLDLTFTNLLRKRAGIDLLTLASLALLGHAALLYGLWQQRSSARVEERNNGEGELLAVPKGDRTVFISPKDIRWIEAAGNYVIVHAGSEEHMVRATLDRLSVRLGQDFVRTSRSALVNVRAITGTKAPTRNGDRTLILQCGRELRLTRKFRSSVLERLPLLD